MGIYKHGIDDFAAMSNSRTLSSNSWRRKVLRLEVLTEEGAQKQRMELKILFSFTRWIACRKRVYSGGTTQNGFVFRPRSVVQLVVLLCYWSSRICTNLSVAEIVGPSTHDWA